MSILYDLIGIFVITLHLPLYILRGKFHKGFSRRLGILPADLKLGRPIWIHAVSVGEAAVVRGLIQRLRAVYPGRAFVISTVTATGNTIARGFAGAGDFVTYLPLDIGFIVRRVLKIIAPSIFIIVETEIWPNLISALAAMRIPVVMVNGRVSDRSFKGYMRVRFLLRGVLRKITLLCVQTETDARRLELLGTPPEKIKVTGNMKFDPVNPDRSRAASIGAAAAPGESVRKKLGIGSADIVITAGSTHAGEEEKILGVYENVRERACRVHLILAPRHPERAAAVCALIEKYNFSAVRTSRLAESGAAAAQLRRVYLLDTVGELMDYYAAADLVFVGGSLVKNGGHNILEPASLGKPAIIGPHMFNFRDIAELFCAQNAAFMVRSEEELKEKLNYLLEHPGEIEAAGRVAIDLIHRNTGATERVAGLIRDILPA